MLKMIEKKMTKTTLFNAKWTDGGFGGAGANIFRGHSEATRLHLQGGNIPVTAGT